MTRSSRDKLNAIYAGGTIGVAAVIGAIGKSWLLFVLVAAGLFGVLNQTGLIRSSNDRTNTRRR
jgi:hypothetical protein